LGCHFGVSRAPFPEIKNLGMLPFPIRVRAFPRLLDVIELAELYAVLTADGVQKRIHSEGASLCRKK